MTVSVSLTEISESEESPLPMIGRDDFEESPSPKLRRDDEGSEIEEFEIK